MPFPLGAVLSAAPGVISAAADLIRIIREKKTPEVVEPESEKIDSEKINAGKIKELEGLIEKQAQLIEELALNNSNLALAVKNNRIFFAISIVLGVGAITLSIWL
jgi:Tfp pilus assembly PilM family ATPase